MVATKGIQNGVPWKLAPCLVALMDETDNLFPNRATISDGSIGDAAHAARTSDHNPGPDAIVSAVDITDDDSHGCDITTLFDHLIKNRDKRVKYLIHKGFAWYSYPRQDKPAWSRFVYTGINAHSHHGHVSVLDAQLNAGGRWWPTKEVVKPEEPKEENDEMFVVYKDKANNQLYLDRNGIIKNITKYPIEAYQMGAKFGVIEVSRAFILDLVDDVTKVDVVGD